MKNYYATNKKFEKIQIIVNLKYASDNRYMGSISGTDDETNLPIMKKCLLTKDIISSRKDINETYERLKLSNKEKEELEKNDYFTIHFDNKNDYEVVGIEKKMQ
jgi:hypothetical protein